MVLALGGTVQAQDLEPAPLEPEPLEARPLEPAPEARLSPEHPWSAAALLGYTFDFEDGDFNPFGFSIGARGGYTLKQNIYVGAQLLYFGGDSVDTGFGEISSHAVVFGIEGGYDLWVQPVLIRPSLALGLAFSSASAGPIDSSSTDLYIAPGATVLYPIENNKFFVGGDARFWIITADDSVTGLSLMATGGMNF